MTKRKNRRRKSSWHGIATGPLERGATISDVESIRHGFSWGLASRFQDNLELKDQEFAAVLGVSSRTLIRQRKGTSLLDKVASDRLYRVMRVVKLAEHVLEDAELGMQWLRKPQAGLGDRVPLELLDTEPGFEAVESLLQRIEFGAIA